MATIAEILLARGQQEAQNARYRGQQSAQNWSNIGNLVAGGVQQYGQARAQQAADNEEKAVRMAFADGVPSFDTLNQIVGPERATKILGGLSTLRVDPSKGYADRQKVLHDTILGMDALPEGIRAERYPEVRNHLVQNGVIKPDDAPEQYDPNWWKQTLNYGTEQKPAPEPKTREIRVKNPDGSESIQVIEDKPGFTATSAAPPAPVRAPGTLQEQANEALKAGNTAEYKRIMKVISDTAAAGRAPVQDPFASATVSGQAIDPNVGGDKFLATLRPEVARQVKALAEGREPFPTGMSQSRLQPLIQMVTQYDPTFDATNYNARSKARTDLTSPSGTGGKSINSLNTALQHLGKLSDLVETLDNTEFPIANSVMNLVRKETGSTKTTNFNVVAPQAMKEIERLWRGAGGSTADIEDLKKSISQNAGKQQQREALQQFAELVRGKIDSTTQQRDNVFGDKGADIPVLFEPNKGVLQKIDRRSQGLPVIGDTVTVKGKRIKITAIHEDGTFDGDEVQ